MTKNESFILRYDLSMSAGENDLAEIMIYSDIVSWKWREDDPEMTALDFDKLLKEAKDKGATKLKLRINSPGGAVYQAVAMRTMLMNADFNEMTVDIEGLCASAATLLCCVPGAKVTIAEGSQYMIHNPATVAWGTAASFEKTAERLHRMESDFAAIYAKKCGKSEDDIRQMMDDETWMTAKDAVENGFCDALIDGGEIAACASGDQMDAMRRMYEHIPDEVRMEAKPKEAVSTAQGAAEHNTNPKEDETGMDGKEIKDITMQELEAQNPGLVSEVIAKERERVQEIDALTPAGYEQMAKDAKEKGTSAAEYLKMIVKAQKEKGAEFMNARTNEVKPGEQVPGGEPGNNDPAADMKAFAKEMGEYAKAMSAGNEGMY